MSCCAECQGNFGCTMFRKPIGCANCNKLLCSVCSGKYPLIPFDTTKPEDEANDISKNNVVHSYCKACFEKTSLLDFSKTYDVIEADDDHNKEDEGITLVWVHGGGACRRLFHPHAKLLAKRGYRSILLDLPGHGSLSDTKLTLDSCVSTVKSVLEQECLSNNKKDGKKVYYVGGSLGAYTGFYVLSTLQDYFHGAVLMDCGQNVGPDASTKAKVGLWFLRHMSSMMSNKSLMGAMLDVSKKSPADYKLIESTFGAGNFFDQGTAQVECLKAVAPADYIPSLSFPILFFNGSADYRDSENRWLDLCKDKVHSSLKVFDGGDHFFSHDTRFVDDVLDRMDQFFKKTSTA